MTDNANDASAASVKTAVDASSMTLKDSAGSDVTTTLATGNVILWVLATLQLVQ